MERQGTLRTLDIIEQLGFHLILHFVRCSLGTMYFFIWIHISWGTFICVISSSFAIIQVKLHCSVCVSTRTNVLFFWGEWMNYILRNVHQEQCSFPLIVLWGIFTGVTVFCAFWARWNVSSFWGWGRLQNNEPGWTSIQEHITMDGWCMNRTFFFIGFLFPAILTIAEGSKVYWTF